MYDYTIIVRQRGKFRGRRIVPSSNLTLLDVCSLYTNAPRVYIVHVYLIIYRMFVVQYTSGGLTLIETEICIYSM